jgi:hypothetical protein
LSEGVANEENMCCVRADVLSTGGSASGVPGEAPPTRNPLFATGDRVTRAAVAAHAISPSISPRTGASSARLSWQTLRCFWQLPAVFGSLCDQFICAAACSGNLTDDELVTRNQRFVLGFLERVCALMLGSCLLKEE